MADPYKLKDEIRAFVIEQKKKQNTISCRKLVPLVQQQFQLAISKSSINAIIKEQSLSSHVGRPRIRPAMPSAAPIAATVSISPPLLPTPPPPPPVAPVMQAPSLPQQPSTVNPEPEDSSLDDFTKVVESKIIMEIMSTRKDVEFVVNCGCFLLRAADYKSSFSKQLTQIFAPRLPSFRSETLGLFFESMIYQQVFADKVELWHFLGRELAEETSSAIEKAINAMDLTIVHELINIAMQSGKINSAKDLYQVAMQRLNSLVQEFFFPEVYRSLDFPTMYSRFFCLSGKVEKKQNLLAIRLFYPPHFPWSTDIVWQEDFLNTANSINEARILTPEGERIWFDASIGSQK